MPRSSPSPSNSNKPRQNNTLIKKRRHVIPKSTHLCYPYYLSRDILFDLQVRYRVSLSRKTTFLRIFKIVWDFSTDWFSQTFKFTKALHPNPLSKHFIKVLYQSTLSKHVLETLYPNPFSKSFTKVVYQSPLSKSLGNVSKHEIKTRY